MTVVMNGFDEPPDHRGVIVGSRSDAWAGPRRDLLLPVALTVPVALALHAL
jgi:hypothetical protein